jgi:hypothetical protein
MVSIDNNEWMNHDESQYFQVFQYQQEYNMYYVPNIPINQKEINPIIFNERFLIHYLYNLRNFR